jgi:hypothetical protein
MIVIVMMVMMEMIIVALLAYDLRPPVPFPPLHPQNSQHCQFPEVVQYRYPEVWMPWTSTTLT